VEIAFGTQRATLVEVGGGIRTYDVGDWSVLDGYSADEMCTAARGQPLAPWPNRLRGGAYVWDGEQLQVPLDEPDQGNAIHGLTRWRNWTLAEHSAAGATLTLRLHPMPYYPFVLDLAVTYVLDEAGLTVTTTARNAGTRACPFAYGAHPYLSVGTERVDEALLQLAAATYLPTGDGQIPLGREPVVGTPYDFREARLIGTTRIDYAFTDLERTAAGRAELTLAAPNGGRRVIFWIDGAFRHLEVFTGDTIPAPRRRAGLGVEPMTAPPNAFATGEDVTRLEPGAEVTMRWGIRAEH
jgi:aldose 1-epimerase